MGKNTLASGFGFSLACSIIVAEKKGLQKTNWKPKKPKPNQQDSLGTPTAGLHRLFLTLNCFLSSSQSVAQFSEFLIEKISCVFVNSNKRKRKCLLPTPRQQPPRPQTGTERPRTEAPRPSAPKPSPPQPKGSKRNWLKSPLTHPPIAGNNTQDLLLWLACHN